MIKGGYILQPRIIENSDVMRMPPVTREIWLHILRSVNHKNYKGIERGSGFFQYNDIQEALCWYVGYRKETYSKSQIAKSLRRLYESNMIETKKEMRGIAITVCKYDYYQNSENYEGNDEGNTKEVRWKRGGRTINKNDKNVKNDKKNNIEIKNNTTDLKINQEKFDYDKFLDYFNSVSKNKMPSLRTLTKARKDLIKKRVTDYGKKSVQEVIEKALNSTFLTGNGDKSWGKASFDWIMKENNFMKIMEGNYDDKDKKPVLSINNSNDHIPKDTLCRFRSYYAPTKSMQLNKAFYSVYEDAIDEAKMYGYKEPELIEII